MPTSSQFNFDMFNVGKGAGTGTGTFDIYNYLAGPDLSAGVDIPFSGGDFSKSSAPVVDPSGFDFGGQGGANIAAGIQGVGSLASALMAYKQYQLGKDTLAQNKEVFNLNFANQAKITNAQIQDRARRKALENQSIAGDMDAIEAATQAEYEKRKVSGKGI